MTAVPDFTPSLISPQLSEAELFLEQPLKLGVLASGSGSNFEAIAQAIENKELNAVIQVLIYNIPDAKVKERADRWNIPTVFLNHRDYKKREDLDTAIVDILKEYQVEWVIMAGWMRIVTEVLVNAFPNHVINIHPSILPSFKGIHAIEQALQAKVKVTGCTVHLVSVEVDSGLILMQAVVPILSDDTPETLHARIQVQEHRIFPQAIVLAAKLII
ncbi:phosphoribosylglycinamide formyltransferase [Aphanothece hegewaldii CCALA 016]|uniref:Phosphoribosylglycinamide formyltransferase n=1 Tax=Aphanothece hegewaldii CCALA 016 TaxID=2107694 RepID=A0A2T1LXX9_9CHRO|nr:phosphoribosylglycinamide formyltransferase [Aphanothece hegewaldii]PSF37236.1 phosphoribosylglycinamide formyltransferase [Aphanothece hegewaldii CCALA 016]